MNPKVSVERGVVDDCPVMFRVEATDEGSGAKHRILIGLSKEDATSMRDDLSRILGDVERLYVDCVSMDDRGVSGMSLYRDGGAEEGDRPVLVTLLPWDTVGATP